MLKFPNAFQGDLFIFLFFSSPQKDDGTCRTDFKKTRKKQDVIQVFKDFVSGDLGLIVRLFDPLSVDTFQIRLKCLAKANMMSLS